MITTTTTTTPRLFNCINCRLGSQRQQTKLVGPKEHTGLIVRPRSAQITRKTPRHAVVASATAGAAAAVAGIPKTYGYCISLVAHFDVHVMHEKFTRPPGAVKVFDGLSCVYSCCCTMDGGPCDQSKKGSVRVTACYTSDHYLLQAFMFMISCI